MGGLLAGVGAVAVAGLTALATYLVARRSTSGHVSTSTAETLWAEADKLRQVYRDESEQNRAESARLRGEVSQLRGEVQKLRDESAAQRADAREQRAESRACREENAVLRQKLDEAYAELASKRGREHE